MKHTMKKVLLRTFFLHPSHILFYEYNLLGATAGETTVIILVIESIRKNELAYYYYFNLINTHSTIIQYRTYSIF